MTDETAGRPVSGRVGVALTIMIANACLMIVEITAGRITSKYLGQSVYTWTSVIGVVLAGLAIGNWLGGWLADRRSPRPTASVLFALAAASCLTIPPINNWSGNQLLLIRLDWPVRILAHVLVTFLTPAVLIGAVSPVIGKAALERGGGTGRALGNLYAWAAWGSIAGTFLAGYGLIGTMSLNSIVAMVAAILAVLAILYAVRRPAGWMILAVAGAAWWGAAGCTPSAVALGRSIRFLDPAQPGVVDYYEKDGSYSSVRVWAREKAPALRIMSLDRLQHSVVNLNDSSRLLSHYAWVVDGVMRVYWGDDAPVRALVLGGGGYTLPLALAAGRPGSDITVAEIDPCVTDAAIQACGLPPAPGFRIVHEDGRNVVDDLLRTASGGGGQMDCIIGDTINDCAMPFHLATREFNDKVLSLLRPGGIYLLHVIDERESPLFLGVMLNTLGRTFPSVRVLAATSVRTRRSGFVVVCSRQPEEKLSETADSVRRRYPSYAGGLVMPEEQAAMCGLAKGLVLTDAYAPVDQLVTYLVRSNHTDLEDKTVSLSRRSLDAGDVAGAMKLVEDLLRDVPDSARVRYQRGVIQARQRQYREAGESLREVRAQAPEMLEARLLLADCLARAGALPEARAEWESILADNPGDADALASIGLACEAEGHPEEAARYWQKAIQVDPDQATANFYLGKSLFRAGDVSGAMACARRVKPGAPVVEAYAAASNSVAPGASRLFY